jgi:integrase
MRLFLHDKGKREPREVELSAKATSDLHAYVSAFNRWALSTRCAARVRLGQHGSIWRNSGRGRWSYRDINSTLQTACVAREVTPFTPHAFRRAFATDAAELFPRHVVAQAGGWKGLERLDDHYIHPRAFDIWSRVASLAVPTAPPLQSEIESDSADSAFWS